MVSITMENGTQGSFNVTAENREKERFYAICEDEKVELLARLNWGIDIFRVNIIRMNNKQTIGFRMVRRIMQVLEVRCFPLKRRNKE